MKRFNKILAVVLVISILASFMGVSVFAADTANASYRFSIRNTDGDVISSAKEGDVIDLVIGIKTNAYTPTFAINFCYDYTAVTQIKQNGTSTATINATNCRQLLGRFADKSTIEEYVDGDIYWEYDEANDCNGYYLEWGNGTSTATPHKDTMYPSSWGDTEKAQYKCVNFSYITDVSDVVAVPNTFGEFYDVVRFRFIAIKDTTLDDTIFFTNPNKNLTYIAVDPDDVPFSNAQTSDSIKATALTVEYDVAAAPTYLVNPVKNQIQWNDQSAGIVNIGVVAGFNADDIKINFVNGVSDNVTKIGTIFKINGEVQPGELTTNRVYSVNGGEAYYFRIVLGNISVSTEDTYSVTPYVMYDGEPVYGPEIKITPDDVATLVEKIS